MGNVEDNAVTGAIASLDSAWLRTALERGGDPNAKIGAALALHLAALSGSLENVELLIKGGADVNGRGDGDDTPLHFAAAGKGPDSIAIARRLIEAGSDVNASGIRGRFPLDVAAESQNKNVALVLMEAGGKCASDKMSWAKSILENKGRSAGKEV